MKVILIDHEKKVLPGDFYCPVTSLNGPFYVDCIRSNDAYQWVAMKIMSGGVGIWHSDGKLKKYWPDGCALAWCSGGRDLLLVQASKKVGGPFVTIRKLDSSTFQTKAESLVRLPRGGCEFASCGNSEDSLLLYWRDQTEWGYIVVDIETGSVQGNCYRESLALSYPQWSSDRGLVISCESIQRGWWIGGEDEYWEHPSEGGRFHIGNILVHNMRTNNLKERKVYVNLAKGWIPEQGEDSEWQGIWGPEIIDEESIRIWLPDNSSTTLDILSGADLDLGPLSQTRLDQATAPPSPPPS